MNDEPELQEDPYLSGKISKKFKDNDVPQAIGSIQVLPVVNGETIQPPQKKRSSRNDEEKDRKTGTFGNLSNDLP